MTPFRRYLIERAVPATRRLTPSWLRALGPMDVTPAGALSVVIGFLVVALIHGLYPQHSYGVGWNIFFGILAAVLVIESRTVWVLVTIFVAHKLDVPVTSWTLRVGGIQIDGTHDPEKFQAVATAAFWGFSAYVAVVITLFFVPVIGHLVAVASVFSWLATQIVRMIEPVEAE